VVIRVLMSRWAAASGLASVVLVLGLTQAVPVRADSPGMRVISVSPNNFGAPTVGPVQVYGSGFSPGDTVTDVTDPSGVSFSEVQYGDSGQLQTVVTTSKPSFGTDDIEVRSADGTQNATCSGCLSTSSTLGRSTVVRVTPGDGSMVFSWEPPYVGGLVAPSTAIVTWQAPGGPLQIEQVPDNQTASLSGLTNGVPYRVTVSDGTGANSFGLPAYMTADDAFTEETGEVPDAPVLRGEAPCCATVEMTASGVTWQRVGTRYTYTFTPRDGARTVVDRGVGDSDLIRYLDAAGVTVTATATNTIGTSAPSKPVVIRPEVAATPVRHLRGSWSRGWLSLSWRAPRSSGNSPVKRYAVTIVRNSSRRTTSSIDRAYRIRLASGARTTVTLRAVTSAGPGAPRRRTFGAGG
jgi:hypothetical protein